MNKKLFQLVALVLLLVSAASCSKNKEYLGRIPEDAQLVVLADVNTILKSAGGTIEKGEVKLPDYITDAMSNTDVRETEELIDKIKESGIDPRSGAFFVTQSENPIVLLKIDDKKKLTSSLEDLDFDLKEEEDGVKYFVKSSGSDFSEKRYSIAAIDGSFVYILDGMWSSDRKKPIKAVRKVITSGKEESIKGTDAAKYIADGNAGGILVRIPKEASRHMQDMGLSNKVSKLFGTVAMKATLEDEKAVFDVKLFSSDGEEIDKDKIKDIFDTDAHVNESAFDYLSNNTVAAAAMVLSEKILNGDFGEEYGGSNMSLKLIKSMMHKLQGTVVLGFGLNGGIDEFFDFLTGNIQKFEGTVVMEAKKGKSKALLNDFKAMFEMSGQEIESSGNEIIVNAGPSNKIYVKADGDFVIASYHPISKKGKPEIAKAFNFGDYSGGIVIDLPADNELMKDLDIDNDVKCVFTSDFSKLEFSLILEIKGGKEKGIIAKAANIVQDIVAQNRSLSNKYEEAYNRNVVPMFDDWAYDTAEIDMNADWAIDSAAAEEVWAEAVPAAEDYYY